MWPEWLKNWDFRKPAVRIETSDASWPVVEHRYPPMSATTNQEPETYRAETRPENLNRPKVFDPALRQYQAFRAGEPQFASADMEREWHLRRRIVLQAILKRLSDHRLTDSLILRGSTLLSAWFGEAARQPGDLDWIVVPTYRGLHHPESDQLMADVQRALGGTQLTPEVQIPQEGFALCEIWTYEKAPGQRMIVPWNWNGDSPCAGTIQMDFVYGEWMPLPGVQTSIALDGDNPVTLLTASPAQSLAWKLLWLATDSYPMGKDLYDAVLLAVRTMLTADELRVTFEAAKEPLVQWDFELDQLRTSVDWDEFRKEYPRVAGSAAEWVDRLAELLKTPLSNQDIHKEPGSSAGLE